MRFILIILLFLFSLISRSSSDWRMYPNPAKDHVTVEVTDGELPQYFRIYNMQGECVAEKYIGKGMMALRIEIHLRPGMYIVYLEDR